jgi:hypothetical protein
MQTSRRPAMTAILAIAALAMSATPAAADCDPAGPVAEELPVAEIAFVGTVTQVAGGSARFAVEEVWAGTLEREVDILGLAGTVPGRGGPDGGIALAEDDRLWELGAKYLVLPNLHEGALIDHQCTATTEWGPELEALRPADATIHEPTSPEAPTLPLVPLAVLAAVALVGGVSVLAFRRRGDQSA